LGVWNGEPYSFNGKKDLFPSIQNSGNNDGQNKIRSWIPDQETKGVGIRGNYKI
jgi:hypothetical protein